MIFPNNGKRKKGIEGEDRALEYLLGTGMELIARNYRTRYGEIDLIMKKGDCIVFVEVKSGNRDLFPGYLESIDGRKCEKIAKVATEFLENMNSGFRCSRIDAVFVERGTNQEIQHLEDVYCMT